MIDLFKSYLHRFKPHPLTLENTDKPLNIDRR